MAVMEHYSRWLTDVAASLSGDHTRLACHRFAHDDFAVLEDALRVAEDEVHGAGDSAVTVELTLRVNV